MGLTEMIEVKCLQLLVMFELCVPISFNSWRGEDCQSWKDEVVKSGVQQGNQGRGRSCFKP